MATIREIFITAICYVIITPCHFSHPSFSARHPGFRIAKVELGVLAKKEPTVRPNCRSENRCSGQSDFYRQDIRSHLIKMSIQPPPPSPTNLQSFLLRILLSQKFTPRNLCCQIFASNFKLLNKEQLVAPFWNPLEGVFIAFRGNFSEKFKGCLLNETNLGTFGFGVRGGGPGGGGGGLNAVTIPMFSR